MKKICPFLFAAVGIYWLLIFKPTNVSAESTQLINIQVQVSICGNNVVEGGEDCEGSNLDGESCTSLGYVSGALSCDIACSFDTTSCVAHTPTPTPTDGSSNSTPQPTISSSPTATPTAVKQAINNIVEKIDNVLRPLPEPLKQYDFENEGVLKMADLPKLVDIWVGHWQTYIQVSKNVNNQSIEQGSNTTSKNNSLTVAKPCDMNKDGVCNLVDFSILLHYIDE